MQQQQRGRWLSLAHVSLAGWPRIDSEVFEERFRKEATTFSNAAEDPVFGHRLRLEQKNEALEEGERRSILLEVVSCFCLHISSKQWPQNQQRYVHRMSILAWSCPLELATLDQRREERFELMHGCILNVLLDRPFNFSACHSYERGHLMCAVSCSFYQKLGEQSRHLSNMMDEAKEFFGVQILIGRTQQEATERSQEIDRALQLIGMYSLVESSFAIVEPLQPAEFRWPMQMNGRPLELPVVVDWQDRSHDCWLQRVLFDDE